MEKKIGTLQRQLLPWFLLPPNISAITSWSAVPASFFSKHEAFHPLGRGLQSSRLWNRTFQGNKMKKKEKPPSPTWFDYCKGYKPPGSGEITVSCMLPCLTHSCRALPLHEKAHVQCPAGMTEITLEKSQDKGLKQCNSVSWRLLFFTSPITSDCHAQSKINSKPAIFNAFDSSCWHRSHFTVF